MKNVITYLKALWRRGLGSQSSDVSLDCRLTVGSPSVKCGSTLMRLVFILAILLTVGVGNVWGDSNFNTTYGYSDKGTSWTLTDCSDQSSYWLCPTGSDPSIAVIAGIFSNKTITSSVVITINHATYGSGGNPVEGTFKIYNSSACSSQVTATKGGTLASSKTYTNVTYTVSQANAANFSDDLAIKITKPGKQIRLKSITVTFSYTAACTPLTMSEVTATPGNTRIDLSWPTVSNASSYTVTCKVKSTGVSAGTVGSVSGSGPKTCAITGLTNGTAYTWSVMPVGTGSYCSSNTAATGDATPNVYYTVTWKNNGGNYTTTSVANGSKPTFPSNPSSCSDVSTTFYGWSTAEWSGTVDALGGKTVYTAASSMPNVSAAVTYYAVFAKKTTGSETSVMGGTFSDAVGSTGWTSSGTGTYSGNGLKFDGTGDYIRSSDLSSNGYTTVTVKFKAGHNGGSGSVLTFTSIDGSGNVIDTKTFTPTEVYNSQSTINSVTLSGATTIKFVKVEMTSKTNNLGMKYCEIFQTPITYSKYLTSCCTALGSINGSVSWSNAATAVVSWDNIDHVSSWTVKYKTHAAGAYTTWAGEQTVYTKSTTNDSRKVTITGLTPCTDYDFQIIANPASGYCDKDQTIEDSQTHNWTVTKTGVTNVTAASLSAIPATTCSGFGPITITAATGYALPAEIAVTNASKSWNSSTGALSISSVTGNVSITITPTCVPPVVTADPADANYYVGDAPTPLSVTATLASGTLTYLWKVSTNGGSTWSDATGTNNAATYSGASLSTASAGTLKFKCIVGNSEGGCSVESGVATITVAEPSSWKLKGSWDSWEEHTMIEDAGVASYSISLDADSRFEFGFDGGSFYKNNGTIITTTSGWVFNTTDNNCHIHTGPAGTYTFAINTSTKAVTVTYPTVSHPNEHYVYFKNTNVWGTVYGYLANSGNDNKAAAWPGSVMQPTTTICGETYHYAALNAMSGTYNVINFNDGGSGYGHQTSDLSTTGSLGKYNANQDASWHQFKYSISFAGNGNTDGSMSSITELCPGSNQALTSNAFTKTHYTFAGWHADVAVKVGESTIDAGDMIEDAVTIKDIQSDIALTAQWAPDTYTITKTFSNVANAGLPASFTYTGAATTALNSTFTVDATNFFLPSSIAVTMGGTPLTAGSDYTYNNSTGAFTFSAVITGDIVITATATAKLKSIAITTQPTTRKYFAGESFSSTGAVVTATMGDGSTKAVTASTTWTPSGALNAGTGQTVTASYTEGGINQTATTTIDVYSVTVNKKNEDGDAIDVAGVTATWTVGTKALAAGVGSTKYAFKQWEVTGASIGSTTSASTTLSSPTANVVVNAVFWKPRVVKWSVNGNDSYNTGGPTTEVAYNGTISTIPTAPSGLVCASTFVAWTDAAHNNGTTAKASTSYYESKLFTAANQFPNITAETTTFYAVFAEGTGAAVNTVMWSEDWTGATSSSGSGTPSPSDARPSAQGDHSGKTVYGGATITYTDGTGTYVRTNENNAGGTAPELLIKGNENWTISGIPTGGAATLTLEYRTNGTLTVSTSTDNVSIGTKSGSNPYTNTITVGSGVTSFNLSFTQTSNRRIDNVSVKVASVNLTNYVTECDANIVSVTYDANGGSTSCTNTTTDKTEDFTVCSSVPTRDYYTFAGWLCSADSKTYAASATIPAAAIDADFTLTAQWTPVSYSITYNYNGGSAQVDPAPATSYTVESSEITLQTPTKGHDRFDGWYENADLSTGGVKTTIAAGSHENKTYYAKWATRHEIIFDADGATTTIYRADDENLEDDVAGMGSVPDDPDAPSACSSKVFVGWSESEIDDETDDEPADLMKPAAGTVNEDKHYYAVWATQASTSGPVTVFEDALYGKAEDNATFSTYGNWDSFGYVYGCGTSTEGVRVSSKDNGGHLQLKANIGLASVDTIKFKIKSYGDTNGGKITLSSYSGAGTYDNSTSAEFTTTNTSSWEEKTCILRSADNTTDIRFEGEGSKYRVYLKDIKITKAGTVYTYSAYSTSCCATKVTLSQNSPEHGTIAFGKTSVGTCGGDKEVSLTITPATGYQLATYSVATGDGKVGTKTDPGVSLNNNNSAPQNITLTFADEANGAYDVTASFTKMAPTAWTWTYKSEAIPNPINLYVGQTATLNATYTPSGLLNSEQNYDVTKSANLTQTSKTCASPDIHYTFRADAAMDDGTVTLTNQINTSLTTTVHVHVNPLPRVHFEDLVHGKEFADVVATLSENALNPNKTTKTSVDWTTPNANTCEENHLHLVGWIREDWPALVNYLNGTGDAPTTTAIVGAGNDGSGNAYFFAPNASINVLTFNGATFYAVWAEIK